MATEYIKVGSSKGQRVRQPYFTPGQLVIYVGKHPDFAEEKRVGSVGRVRLDERPERNNIEVDWFVGINPTPGTGGVFQENIEPLEEGWVPPAV